MLVTEQRPSQQIAKTGFFVSIISYVVFFGAEALRPGFVARVFSVHVFLLTAIIFGVWWARTHPFVEDRPVWRWVVVLVSSVVLSVLAWHLTAGVSERALVAVCAFLTPLMVTALVREE